MVWSARAANASIVPDEPCCCVALKLVWFAARFGRLPFCLSWWRSHMRRILWCAVAIAAAALFLPANADAQAAISGVAKDSSDLALPGVTVEAASPALIEKTRTTVTDASGQYRIEDLR